MLSGVHFFVAFDEKKNYNVSKEQKMQRRFSDVSFGIQKMQHMPEGIKMAGREKGGVCGTPDCGGSHDIRRIEGVERKKRTAA